MDTATLLFPKTLDEVQKLIDLEVAESIHLDY